MGHVVRQADQLVGGLAHRRNDDDHVVTLAAGPGDVIGHGPDPVGIRDRGAAELLDDEVLLLGGRSHGASRVPAGLRRTLRVSGAYTPAPCLLRNVSASARTVRSDG